MTSTNSNISEQPSAPEIVISKHVKPFYSLDEVKDEAGLRRYWRRFSELRRHFSDTAVDRYYLDCKLTGVPVQILYSHGTISSALTKYDGRKGEDITKVVILLPNVPHHIRTERTVIIRGEIVIHRDDFYLLNQERENDELPTFDTMTECVIDTIHSGNPRLISKYILRFYAWELFVSGAGELTQELQIERLTFFGFNIPRGQICTSIPEMVSFINEIARIRNNLPYEINGVVIKQNDPVYRRTVGVKGGIELSKCVWRFNAGGVACKILNVKWNILRTGRLAPVAEVQPVNINGILVTSASLRSWAYVKDQRLGKDGKIVLDCSADNAPTIIKIIRAGTYEPVPETCPCCGEPLTHSRENVYCRNPHCPAVLEATLNFVVSKEALDYPSFTADLVHEAVRSKTITSLADIFTPIDSKSDRLPQQDLDALVMKMRSINIREFIILLGIPGMGRAIASKIAIEVRNIAGLIRVLNDEEYFHLLGVSPVVKKYLSDWYQIPEHKEFLEIIEELHLPRCS